MASDFTRSKASLILDLVRGLAAVVVLVEHWRNLFFVDYQHISSHRLVWALPYLLSSAGHQAVVIFFVLSGYLISGSVFRMWRRGIWSWRRYFVHRLLRLWIVLIPGLILCALWDAIGIQSHHAPLLYSGGANHMIQNVILNHDATIFLANLTFLQTILTSTFGSNGALWSLANEFWYYVLFPLAFFVFARRSSVLTRVVCGALLIGVAWFVGKGILSGFPIWLIGTLLVLMPAPKCSRFVRIVAGVLYVPIFFLFAKIQFLPPGFRQVPLMWWDYALGAITFVLLWIQLSASEEIKDSVNEKSIRQLSKFSYTLYVSHTPLCVLFVAWLCGDRQWDLTPNHLLIAIPVLVLLIAYAYGLAFVTEFQTDRIRAKLEAYLGLSPTKQIALATPQPDAAAR